MSDYKSWLPYIPYVASGLIVGYILYIEKKDVQCPTLSSSGDECKDGGGMSFSYTKPNPTDSCQTLLDKIRKAAGAEPASIKWRRALILSFSIVTVTSILVGPYSLFTIGGPNGWKPFYLSIMIGFVILLGNYIYYSYHIYGKAETWLKDSLDILQQKCMVR
jgi:hypothetical protein